MQVSNGIGPGVRRSKRPLLASRARYKCSMETSQILVIRSILARRQCSVTRSRVSDMSDLWRVSLYMVMPRMSCNTWDNETILFEEIPIQTVRDHLKAAVTTNKGIH